MDSALLEVTGLRKSYNVPVLKDFDFSLLKGEVHALVGSNGAGKSTFANILCGMTPSSGGLVRLHGKPHTPANRVEAQKGGVVMVMQELNIIPTLTVAENLFFDTLPHRLGWIDRDRLRADAIQALERVGLGQVDPDRQAGTLGIGHQQLIEIAAALARRCEILILDEPTASLTNPEIEELFRQIRMLQQQGVGIIYISHRMEEIREISNRVTVLRDGRRISTHASEELDLSLVIREMAGKSLNIESDPPPGTALQELALEVKHLAVAPVVKDVSFDLKKGEILGLAGLVGSGRTECLKAIFGAEPLTAGTVRIRGREARIRSPREAVALGLGLVPEDRKEEGLLLSRPVRENATLSALEQFARMGWMDLDGEARATLEQAEATELKFDGTEQAVGELSGGNQQKVMMIRWLLKERDILLLDEPTRGIDVAAKDTLYRLLRKLAGEGKAILVVSSELPELIRLCDRICVLSNGRTTGMFDRGEFDEDRITQAAFAGYTQTS